MISKLVVSVVNVDPEQQDLVAVSECTHTCETRTHLTHTHITQTKHRQKQGRTSHTHEKHMLTHAHKQLHTSHAHVTHTHTHDTHTHTANFTGAFRYPQCTHRSHVGELTHTHTHTHAQPISLGRSGTPNVHTGLMWVSSHTHAHTHTHTHAQSTRHTNRPTCAHRMNPRSPRRRTVRS